MIYMIAIDCLARLIAPQQDEIILAETNHWPCGYIQPLLTPGEIQLGEKKAETDLTDVEILEQDVIKCLFRMNLLKRIVYLLDRMKLLPTQTVLKSVKNCFYILIRMARHSMTCANQIFEERQLMDFIIREFIPETAVSENEDRIYGRLLPEALKFCRIIANHGSTLAYNLIDRYGLHRRLRDHLITASNLPSTLQNNYALVELLALWRVLILQGHMANELGSLIPTIILPLCRICIQQMPNIIITQILVEMITVMDALIIHVTKLTHQYRNSSQDSTNSVNWSHIDGFFDLILTIGKQTLVETDEKINFEALRTACISCLASFLIGQHSLRINLLVLPSKVQLILTQLFQPILQLKSTKQIVESIPIETAISSTNTCKNLPTMTQKNISPFGFLLSLFRLTKIMYRIDKSLSTSQRLISGIMVNKQSEILVYVKKMLNKFTSHISRRISWFEHFEHIFLFEFIQTIFEEKSEGDLPSIYYELLLSMLSSLFQNSHYLSEEILRFLLFDSTFWKRSNEMEMSDLSLVPIECLCLASNESISLTSTHRSNLYERATEHFPSLFTYYQNILRLNRPRIDFHHCDVHFGNLFQSDDQVKLSCHYSNRLIDSTWPYGLLSSLYTNVLTVAHPEQKLELILNTLRFVYVLEMKRCLVLRKQLTTTTRFSMIAGIYLLGSDVFLDRTVADYLIAFLNCFEQEHLLEKINTRDHVQSLMIFFDFYRSLVEQYEACSFGDVLFSNYLLVSLQQIYPVHLREHLWIEHSTSLNYLRLKPDELLFPMQTLFIPYENDLNMIRYYAHLLTNGTVKKLVQPLLYMIAIHHLNSFLFDQTKHDHITSQKNIWKNLKSISSVDKILYDDIVNYKTFSRDGPVLFTTLPSIRVNWLEKLAV